MLEKLASASAKAKRGRSIKWRRLLVFFGIFIILLYLLSLVLLNTSWAKNKLINRLNEKSNSSWEVGSVLWVPFGDVELSDLKARMGEGGIHIKSLKVEPSWSNLFSGSVELLSVTADEADVDLDLKWLKENLSKNQDIGSTDEPQRSPVTKPRPNPQPKPPKGGEAPTGKPQVKPIQKPTPKPAVVKEVELNDLPNRWLKVGKLNLTVRNGTEVLEEISNVSVSIPFAGKPIDGEIGFQFDGDEYVKAISWDGQSLHAEELAGELFNVKYGWKGMCRISQPGTPFAFRFKVPQQKLNYTLNDPNLHWNVSSDVVMVNFTLNGSLRNPNTWRGIINAGSGNTTISETQKTHKRLEFDHTRLVGTIRSGQFNIPVAEAIGHKVSILANGSIHRNLYSYGVMRLISNDEASGFLYKLYHGTKFLHIDKSPYHLLWPLDAPDRRYCDVYVDGKLSDLEVRHDRSERWQSLNKALKRLRDFKDNELQEDGLLEPVQ